MRLHLLRDLRACPGILARLLDAEYWNASIYARFDFTDAVYTEASLGYASVEAQSFDVSALGLTDASYDADVVVANGAIIYQPADQVAFGLQADYVDRNVSNTDTVRRYSDSQSWSASFVSWVRF